MLVCLPTSACRWRQCGYTTLPTAVSTSLGVEAHYSIDEVNTTCSWDIKLMDNGAINLSFSAQYFKTILKAYNLEKCKPSAMPGKKKPPIAAEPLDKEQHSMYRTA
eukprot:1168300-Amphidinium_carterae.2